MKSKILKILCDNEEFVSGQRICSELDISRTAVWKYIKILKAEGYEILAVNNKGYKLIASPDIINVSAIKRFINTEKVAEKIIYLEDTASTNAYAKKLGEQGMENGTLVVAEQQTMGKGRRGKNWSSPKGTGIFMTLLLRPELEPDKASMITLVAAMAVASALSEFFDDKLSIKWPNDIVINNKKVCGILTEMSTEMEYINYIVVGIGVNVNNESFSEEISNIATSMKIEGKRSFVRSEIIGIIIEQFEIYYNRFLLAKDLTPIMEEYNKKLINIGKKVKVIEKEEEKVYLSKGINNLGELVVLDENNKEKIIISGEVSVRGLYGYV